MTLSKVSATRHRIAEDAGGQRIDNYLLKTLKGVPKSRIYRMLRGGEVRVNSGRIGPDYRLQPGDELRLPPVRMAEPGHRSAPAAGAGPALSIVYEDDHLIALDKPAGLAVHGGSGVSFGVIELLRAQRPQARFLELVHRLDRGTSGLLLIARKRGALVALQDALRAGQVGKVYLALVKGEWRTPRQSVQLSLQKYVLASGERRVAVDASGKAAHTVFRLERAWSDFSLLSAELKTGRTHQIRVHLAHLGFPIAGDDKYGDFELNRRLARRGLKRMFLHAASVGFEHPATGAWLTLESPLPAGLQAFLRNLDKAPARNHE